LLHGASPRGFLRLKFMKKDPFLQKDCSDHQIFTMNGLVTDRYLASDDDTGIFLGRDKVVIKTADTAIVLGNGQIKLDGSVTKSQIIDSSGRGIIENPISAVLPSSVPTAPGAFTHIPDPSVLSPFLGLGITFSLLGKLISDVLGG